MMLRLQMHERQKSLEFYKSLQSMQLVENNAHTQQIQEFKGCINQILTREIGLQEEVQSYTEQTTETMQGIVLPNPLPDDLILALQTCINDANQGSLPQLCLVALGIESSHVKNCDFLLKKTEDSLTKDFLYRLQALSFNHHILVLKDILTKLNVGYTQQSALSGFMESILQNKKIQDYAGFLPFCMQIFTKEITQFSSQTKQILTKLQNNKLSHDELVSFLEKLNFPLVGGGILGSFCVMILADFMSKR